MSEYLAREYAIHVRGCRHDGAHMDTAESVTRERAIELLTTGDLPITGRAHESWPNRRRRACGMCKPDASLGLSVITLPRDVPMGEPIGGRYVLDAPNG